METVVIGAGPAGLTVAYELGKLGVTSTILEADTQVGGISRTVNYRGYRFDIGGHRFFSKVPLINELWNEILGEDFLIRSRLSRIHFDGRFFDYPLKAFKALAQLGVVEALLVGVSYAKAKIAPSLPETTFEQWVSNRFGWRLYEIFFKAYTEKVWGIPCSEISAEWAAQRIRNLSLTEALRNALFGNGRTKDGQIVTSLIDEFHYPRLGPGMMWERCESLIREQGNKTIQGSTVQKIRHRNGRVECVEARDLAGETAEFQADHFISSMPLNHLVQSLDPQPPDDVMRAAAGLRYRDFLTVVLIVPREHVFPDNWIYIHAPEVKMGRIQNYKNWSPEMVPDPSKTSLGLEYFLSEHDDLWSWSDQRLIEFGAEECAQLGFIERNEVEDGTIVRMKKAYPIYDQTYADNVATIRSYLDGIKNLQTIGRNGQHRYNNQDHSMMTGLYAARNVIGERHDVWAVNVDEEYHEEARGVRVAGEAMPRTEQAQLEDILAAAFARIDPLALGVAIGVICGLGLFFASAILLLKGGDTVGPQLSLLGHFLIGFRVTWVCMLLGVVEAAIIGFVFGWGCAWLRNALIDAYVYHIKRAAEAKERRAILDRM